MISVFESVLPNGFSIAGARRLVMTIVMTMALLLVPAVAVQAQVARSMTNGGFESNNPGGGGAANFEIFASSAVPGWEASTSQIELWDTNYLSILAHSGNVFAEMNANTEGSLYQNICLINGETLRWSFAHRARSGGATTQTALFQIANSGGTVLQTLATQASTTAQAWNVNSNSSGVTYNGASGVQRVQFETNDTGSIGNFVDSVQLDIVPFLEYSTATASGSETVATANLPTLVVTGVVPVAFTVPVTITGGTATLGTDYTTPGGATTFNVTIPAGTYNLQAIALGISITNEAVREFDETITLSVGTSANHILSSTSTCGSAARITTTYTIVNDDATRTAGTPPTLVCPVGTTLFDWDTRAWTAGATSANFAVTNIGTILFALTNSSGTWLNNATYGGQSPARQNTMTGGFSPAQFSLAQLVNLTSRTALVTTTITLPTAVPGLQFRLFDVDFGSGQFADQVTVTGSFGGTTVTPTLTNGIANLVAGNSAFGDATSADGSADGNVVVTFASPVDTVIISYGNHSAAPNNPGNQAITLHDIIFCNPQAAVTLAKTSSIVSDPVNGTTDPKFIPGAIVRYCLLATNAGSATSTAIAITDSLPVSVTFVPGSMSSATDCSAAGTPEDDNAGGGDESDPFGMQISGATVGGTASSIGPGAAFAMRFNAVVN
jgi:uncharacterized repeat protein (TIGR01451 family)